MAELLKVDNVSMVFGGLRAVSNLSMHIDEGELIGLIGPNGAGNSSFLFWRITMSQIRLVADSSCDLLSLDGVDFVSVPLTCG